MSEINEFSGKVAIVTGAASGIGEAIALSLLNAGAQVIAVDIDAIGNTLKGNAERPWKRRFDVAHESSWKALFEELRTGPGRLDMLVNVAGVLEAGSLEAISAASLMRMLEVNTQGAFIGCREAIGLMKQGSHPASIVNIASANAVKAQSWTCGYAASKAAVASLTKTTALHCAESGYNIRVNAILPGIVLTPMVQRLIDAAPDKAAAIENLKSYHPVKRLLDPSEIASVTLFLGSSAASGITGSLIPVDLGMTAF